MHIDDVVERLGGACPVTGPIYVRGAEPGAALAIEIHRIEASPRQGTAWTGMFGGFGALSHEQFSLQEPLVPESRLLPYDEEQAHFLRSDGSTIAIPIRPFLGTVGVAPRDGSAGCRSPSRLSTSAMSTFQISPRAPR